MNRASKSTRRDRQVQEFEKRDLGQGVEVTAWITFVLHISAADQ